MLIIFIALACADDFSYEVEEDQTDYKDTMLKENEDDPSKAIRRVFDDANTTMATKTKNKKKQKDVPKPTLSRTTYKSKLKSKKPLSDLIRGFNEAKARLESAYNKAIVGDTIILATEKIDASGDEERTFKKGTVTSGHHNIHRVDDYKKEKVFFDTKESSGGIKKGGQKYIGFKTGPKAKRTGARQEETGKRSSEESSGEE